MVVTNDVIVEIQSNLDGFDLTVKMVNETYKIHIIKKTMIAFWLI